MPYETFQKLTDQLARYFQNKQYAEALELISTEGVNFPNDRMMADYWRMVSAARVGNRTLLFEVARKSLADGLWHGEVLWRQSPSYASLQGDPEFEQIVAESLKVQRMDMPTNGPIVITKLPADHSSQSPLLIALHGNQSILACFYPAMSLYRMPGRERRKWLPSTRLYRCRGWVIPHWSPSLRKSGQSCSARLIVYKFARLGNDFSSDVKCDHPDVIIGVVCG